MPIEISFDGIIGESPNTAADVRALLRAGGPVELSINSPGGIAHEGLAIFNLLRAHPGRIDVTVDALAASAASLIAMAGDTITMRAGALMMIHDPSGVTVGPASAHEKSRDVLDKMGDQFAQIYAQRSGLSKSRVRAMMREELWMDPAESVENGFASAASDEGATASAPLFDYGLFKHAPATLLALAPQSPARKTPMAKKPNAATLEDNDDDVVVDTTNEILTRGAKAGLTATAIANIVLQAKGDVGKAAGLIIDALAESAGDQRHAQLGNGDGLGNPHTLATAVGDVLYARMANQPVKAGTPAEDLAGRSLLDLGAMLIQANGGKVKSWHRDRLASQIMMLGGPHSTSDFPILTQEAGNRILLDAYRVAESPLKQVARRRSASDFRSIAVARLGEMPALLEVGEGAEIKYGSRTESHEAFRLRTWARIFSITRQALISDDLSAFADSARAWGIAAATLEADELFAIIAGNGAIMEDGLTLFHADHGNVAGSATALDVDGLSAGRQSIRVTKGLDNTTRLGLAPKFLVVGPANETAAEKVLSSLNASQVSDVNPFGNGKLSLLVETRIDDYAWMLFAEPNAAEVLAFANLGDRTGPELETKAGWTVLGQEFRCVHDFGAGATGYRGTYKNAGAPAED